MDVILVAAAMFGLCFLLDKAYAKLFRSKVQHKTGLSVRQNKRYGSIGLVLFVIGVAAFVSGLGEANTALIVGSIIVAVLGIGLIVYYMSFGIYYDDDGFIVESFGKKAETYRYDQIIHQQLYVLQGGGVIVELHLQGGKAVQIASNMPNYDQFLKHAFGHWCRQKGIDPEACEFHDPANSLWFPTKEEL